MTSPNNGFDVFAVVESEGVELFDPNERFEIRSEALSIMSSREFKKGDTSLTNPTNNGLSRSTSGLREPTFGVNPALLKMQLSNIQERKEEDF